MDFNNFFCVVFVQIYSYLFFNVTAVSSDDLLDPGPERLAGLDDLRSLSNRLNSSMADCVIDSMFAWNLLLILPSKTPHTK